MSILRCTNLFLKNKKDFFSNFKQSQKVFPRGSFRSYKHVSPKTKYGGRFMVTMLPGDGYGPQLTQYVKDIFQIADAPVDFEEVLLDAAFEHSKYVHEAVTSIMRNGIAIKGNISTKSRNFESQSSNVILRRKLNLFANVLHCKSHPGIETRHDNVDIILIRQNTEGEYSCVEHEITPGVVESLKIVTRERSEEIAHFAFEYAIRKSRKRVTSVHKASVMPMTDGLFLNTCISVARQYPKIKFDFMFMDTCCMRIVTNPQQFDVFLLPNLYGNVLNNIACGLIGGAGLASGQNFGPDCVIFEIGTRGSVTSSNPVAMLNASVDLLSYLGLEAHAGIIGNAIYETLNVDRLLTRDLGGCADVSDVINRVIEIIKATKSY